MTLTVFIVLSTFDKFVYYISVAVFIIVSADINLFAHIILLVVLLIKMAR